MHRLANPWRHYEWGSLSAIPAFTKTDAPGTPVAEMWLGTHELDPSRILDSGRLLSEVAGEIPFMLKVLAADKPLSIQVHPAEKDAREGFEAESSAGMSLDDAKRSFKDPNAKPEMIFALSTFETLVGFRPTAQILRILAIVDTDITRRLAQQLDADPGFAGIVRLVETILTDSAISQDDIEETVSRCRELVSSGVDVRRAFVTVQELAEHYPFDRGVLVSLLLNRMTLQPGEATYLEPGIIHCHLSGICLEIMSNSDNVLRAGLTTKHVDISAMVRTLKSGMSRLSRINPETVDEYTEIFRLPEFALAVTGAPRDRTIPLQIQGTQFVLCIGGKAVISNSHGEEVVLRRGQSVYADSSDGQLTLSGMCEIVQAFKPVHADPLSAVDLV